MALALNELLGQGWSRRYLCACGAGELLDVERICGLNMEDELTGIRKDSTIGRGGIL